MNVNTLHHPAAHMGLPFRALVLGLTLMGLGQLRAQPFDTLMNRLRGLPVDTLEARERAATDPRVKCAAIYRLTGQYLYLGRPEDCMTAAIRGLEVAEPTGNDTLVGQAHFGIGVAYTGLNDMTGALKHFNLAFERFQQTGDSLRMGGVCKETAIVYQRAGDTEGTLRYMRKAQGYGLSEGIYGRSMSVLAKCYLERGDLDSALYYARKADVLKAPGKDPFGYANYQLVLAAVYAARGENDLAEPYYKRSLAVADSSGLPEQFLNAAAGYAKLLVGQGRGVEALDWAKKGYGATLTRSSPASW